MKKLTLFLLATFLTLVMSGCGAGPSPTATSVPPTPTPVPPMPTPIPTDTPLPPTATAAAPEPGAEWDYVALGDSATWGMVSRYAAMLEQDLGVKVRVHDRTRGSDHSSRLLERLRTDSELRRELGEAEVITFEIPWNVFQRPAITFEIGSPGDCGGAENQDCLREALETYKADTDAIIAEIVSLRSPSEALIRTQDTYQFRVRESKEAGTFEVINRYWRDANAHVIEVATRYHIPVARVYDAFMGINGTEDPRDKGLMVVDGFHTTSEGATLMAELFRELGYEPLGP